MYVSDSVSTFLLKFAFEYTLEILENCIPNYKLYMYKLISFWLHIFRFIDALGCSCMLWQLETLWVMVRQVGLLPAGCQPWNNDVVATSGDRFVYCATLAMYIYQVAW